MESEACKLQVERAKKEKQKLLNYQDSLHDDGIGWSKIVWRIEKKKQLEIEEWQQDSIHIVSKAKEVSQDSSQVLPLPPNQTLLKSWSWN